MARTLKAKQKAILKGQTARDIEGLPSGVWEQLEAIHDYETLWQDVNRFLWDQAMEKGAGLMTSRY